MVAKMLVGHLITNYDIKIADAKAPSTLNWGIACVPHPRMAMLVRERGF